MLGLPMTVDRISTIYIPSGSAPILKQSHVNLPIRELDEEDLPKAKE